MVKSCRELISVYKQIVNHYKDDEDVLFFLKEEMKSFGAYVKTVYNEEVLLPIYRFKYEGDDLRDRIVSLDRKRKFAHDSAINACKFLDRIAAHTQDGLAFYGGNYEDRYAVAEFCQLVVDTFYEKGIDKPRDCEDTLHK